MMKHRGRQVLGLQTEGSVGRSHHDHHDHDARHHAKHGEHGRRRHGGPKVGRGDVRVAILILLAEAPRHGYEIIQEVATRSGDRWRPSAGSVYPALQLLEDQGLIRGDQGTERRVYYLTEDGRAHVAQRREELMAVWAEATATDNDPARELRELYEQLGDAVQQVARSGSETQLATICEVLTNARRQVYRVLADDET